MKIFKTFFGTVILYVMFFPPAYCENVQVAKSNSSEITLQGILQLGEFFGRPCWGEEPATDRIEQVYYLQLPTLLSRELKFINKKELGNLAEGTMVHVFSFNKNVNFEDKVGKKIKVVGRLSGWSTEHHHAPTIMDVRSVEEIKSWKW